MTSGMICRKTMMECQTPGMCAPFGGCHADPPQTNQGWICGRCQTSNAPWAATCQNIMCGKSWNVTCGASVPTDIHERVEMDPNVVPLSTPLANPLSQYLQDSHFNPPFKSVNDAFEEAQDKAIAAIKQLEQERTLDPYDLGRPMSEFPK
jgi:hypothetical protein